jgi:hypothetical protein
MEKGLKQKIFGKPVKQEEGYISSN